MKTILKKLLLVLAIIVSSFTLLTPLATPHLVYADNDICGDPNTAQSVKDAAGCSGSEDLVSGIIINILYVVIFVVGVVSVIYIVVGGVKYMSSRGDPNATQTAKKTILYAFIGLIITSLAFIIVNFSIGVIYGNGAAPGSSNYEGPDPSEQKPKLDDNNEITEFSLSGNKVILVGSTGKIKAHITPYWLSNIPLTWESSDPSVATVDDQGRITAQKEGVTVITATSENGKSANITITVSKPIEPEKVTLNPSTVNLTKGKSATIKATVLPANANRKHITWSSKDKSIASVNSRGQVTGKKAGTTTITAKTENGKSASAKVKVTDDTNDGPVQVNKSLLNELKSYHQTNYEITSSSNTVSCYKGGNAGVGQEGCGISAYLAVQHLFNGKKVDYVAFAKKICNAKLSIPVAVDALANKFKKTYHVGLTEISKNTVKNALWDASVKALKQGHPLIYLITDTRLARGSLHYITGITYDEDKGIYIWNPNTKNEGWYKKSDFFTATRAWTARKTK